ncbi:hypothetical protein [Taibaiella soli]|uniref:Uncharacterized protein n=1 Tax=Taibaiella soli TaxID=1649169 RepID=A0A2W2B9D0_9BACT|nr:hypothetical protein [Taibaiella soli]PZF72517.1 hypothetical protein DN068_11675 [Taibaiella soli]
MKRNQIPAVIYTDRELQPMFLSGNEIADPQKVLSQFFDRYTLPDFRACFGSLLNDALHNTVLPEDVVKAHQALALEVVQVVEAAFLLEDRG